MEALILEIRAAEGGDHAKALVEWQFAVYCRYAFKKQLSVELLERRAGFIAARVAGPKALEAFAHESGGHRIQQIPQNDDRVHTSTITVAVFREPEETELVLRESDLEFQAIRGSGAGGQNRNKVSSAIRVTHKPTGTVVRVETERDQHKNKKLALSILRARLIQAKETSVHAARNQDRREQVGIGARGDKRRTIAVQRNSVLDHLTGQRWTFKDYEKGNW